MTNKITNKITIYTTEPCASCQATKEMMAFHEVNYEEVATHKLNDDSILEMLRDKGFAKFPVVKVNDWEDSWCDFQPDKIEKYSEKFKG